jgi:hypothetical protein
VSDENVQVRQRRPLVCWCTRLLTVFAFPQVFVRVRPLISREKGTEQAIIVEGSNVRHTCFAAGGVFRVKRPFSHVS